MLHLNLADAPSQLMGRPEGLGGSWWVVDSCWAPSRLSLNTKGTFQFTQHLVAGPWALTGAGAGGSVESEGTGVTAASIDGAKAAERALPEPNFPHVVMGRETCPGHPWGRDKLPPRCGEKWSPEGSACPAAPASSVWLPAGTSGRAAAEERVADAWRPLPKLSWEGRERGWTCGNVGERSAFREEGPSTASFRCFLFGLQEILGRSAPSVTVPCKSSDAVAGWLKLPGSVASCCQVTSPCVSRDGLPAALLRTAWEGLGDPQEPSKA